LGNQHLGGGQRHQDHDDEGDDGPDDLDRHRLVEIGRLVAHRLAVLPDRIEHDRKHGDEDHRAQDHHEVVKPVLLFGDLGDRRVQIELAHRRAAGQVVDSPRRSTDPGACRNPQVEQQCSQFAGNALHRVHFFYNPPLIDFACRPLQEALNAVRISRASAGRNSGRT
jgi:hypothetical protein